MTARDDTFVVVNRIALLRPIAWALAAALALPPAPLLAQGATRAANGANGSNGKRGGVATSEEQVMLNFVNSDLEQTVRAIGQFTGRQFVIDPRVKGTLTLVTERPVNKQQAYEQLLSALRLQGFTIVESPTRGGVSRVLPEADAKLQGGRVIAPTAAPPRGDQIVTQVFRLQYESATAMVPVLRPLIAPNNTISAFPANNSLVITDYADNLRRIEQIIATIDQAGAAEAEVITLQHGLAVEIAAVANRVLDEGARAAGQASDPGQRVQVLAEPRTNTLIVRASSRSRLYVAKQFIERLDQPSVTPGNINVIYLRNAQAVRLAQTLRAVLSSDPSFVPQAGGTGGLSGGSIASTGSGLSTQPRSQPVQPSPAAQPQTGAAGTGSGGGSLAGLIQADAATNSLIITAPEPLFRNIRAIVEKLDVRPAQVVIESLIVEILADKAAEFGIQWQALGGFKEGNSDSTSVIGGTNFGARGSGNNIVDGAQNLGALGQGLNLGIIRGKVNIPGIGEITNLAFLARALEGTADANVLSTPTIQTLDNEEAKFLVGQNVPLLTGQFSNTGGAGGAINPFQTFERQDVGIQLRVKPQISEGGVVRLAIYQEVSSVVPGTGTSSSGVTLNKRSFESNVLVEDGNIVVLSGLIEDRTTGTTQAVPFLGNIPLLGWLFKYETRERRRTNLLVFLRPRVVRDESTSSALAADRYEMMRAQLAAANKPDNLVFQGLKGAEVPPLVPPLRAPQSGAPGSTAPSASPGTQTAPVLSPDAATVPLTPPAEPAASLAPATTDAAPGDPSARPGAAMASGAFVATPAAPEPRDGMQLIQVAAVASIERGRELQSELRAAGFDAYWENVRTPQGNSIVRVRVAVDRATQSVSVVMGELTRRGYEPILVKP